MTFGGRQPFGRAVGVLCAVAGFCVVVPQAGLAFQEPSAGRDSADAAARKADSAYEAGTKEGAEASIGYYLRAADWYRSAGAQARAAEMLSNAAYVHNSLGRPDSALTQYRRLIGFLHETNQRAALGETLTLVGEVFHGLGQLDSALAHYRQGLLLARESGDRRTEGRTVSDIGVAFQGLGRPDSAQRYLNRALVIRQQLGDSMGEAVTLNNLATVLQKLGRPDSAIAYLRQSLVLRRAVNDRAGEGTTLNNIGYSFELLAERDSAFAYYRQALAVLRAGGRRSTVGITLANMGRVWLELGVLDSAVAYLNEGLAVKREVRDKTGESWALNDLGRAYQSLGRPDTALRLLNEALALLRETGDRAREGETLYNLAEVYRRSLKDPHTATAYYDSAAAVRASVGSFAGSDDNRLSFAEQDVRLFENWALSWLALAPGVGREESALASLAAVERGRAQALLDLIRASAGQRSPGAGRAASVPTRAGANLVEEGRSLVDGARRSGAATVYCLVTPDTLLVWLIPPAGEVRVARRAISRDSLAGLVAALRGGLGVDDVSGLENPVARPTVRRGVRFAESAALALADLLLPVELEERLGGPTELVIVPQGPLALVPFGVLPLGRSHTALAQPFGSDLPMRYVPSLASWSEAEARPGLPRDGQRAAELRRAVVVGNPTMPGVMGAAGDPVQLTPLPNAAVEASWLARRLGAVARTGGSATEMAVRGLLPGAALVHLATHGYAFASEDRVRQSFVALAPGGGGDGVLTVGEILDDPALTLRAELVVLSACQTGLGDLKQAEGTVGLQRAFLAKGARSVLVSLWSVSDVVTGVLMQRFYTHWLEDPEGPSKATALWRAQEDVRRTPGYAHPRFWAAFQLVGAR